MNVEKDPIGINIMSGIFDALGPKDFEKRIKEHFSKNGVRYDELIRISRIESLIS